MALLFLVGHLLYDVYAILHNNAVQTSYKESCITPVYQKKSSESNMKIVFMKFGTKRQLFLNFDVMLLTPVYLDIFLVI